MRVPVSATCDPSAAQVTRGLGFDCNDVSPIVSVRAPWDLANGTLPVLELLVIAGAVFALWHAVRRHRAGDSTNLALWCASLVYLFVTEPPLYFPEWFGLDEIYGFIFAHNQFTVNVMWDRLPLYIIAFYPMLISLAYELVRSLGVFARGPIRGAVAVAFVCQVFYEVFDHLGPQLKWWAWNQDNDLVNHPMLASVPMNSMLLFASVSFGALAWLVTKLVGTAPRSGGSLVWRILLAGVLAPPTMAIAGIPSGFFDGNVTAQAWVLGIELGLVWVLGIWVLWPARPVGETSLFGRVYPAVYALVLAALWLVALPSYGGADSGSWPYVLACFAGIGWLLWLQRREAAQPVTA